MTNATPEEVVVHPLVLLSVVDHYNRLSVRPPKRVVGVLLGKWQGNVVHVTNSYAIPFEEDDKDPSVWFLDHNYHENMHSLFRKVNAKENIVGWYHSGPKLRSSDLDINQVFKKYISRPVLVIIDVQPRDLGLPTDAYFAVEEIHDDGTATTKTFAHVSSVVEAEEAEEIGVEHLLRDIKDNAVGTVSTRVNDLFLSLKGLHVQLTDIESYIDRVIEGELPINHPILYNLQDIFNLLPNLNQDEIAKAFAIATNDQYLVIYLASLVRSIISLHDLITNKISNTDLEASNELVK